MKKVIFVLAVFCAVCANCLDRRLQHSNQDFLNFEANLAKTTTAKPGSVPGVVHPDLIPPNRPPNQQTGGSTKPASATGTTVGKTSGTTKPAQGATSPGPVGTTSGVRPAQGSAPNSANSGGARPTAGTTVGGTTSGGTAKPAQGATSPGPVNPKANPAVANSGSATSPSLPTPKPAFSWASVVSGNKSPTPGQQPGQSSTAGGGNVPTTPRTFSPGLPPIKSASSLQPIPYPSLPRVTPGNGGPTTEAAPEIASDKELKEVSEALLKKETGGLAKHVTINYQGKTSSFSKDDQAPQPLIVLKPEIWNEPIIAAMKVLLDNYEQDTLVNEYVTPQEKNEENSFLDLVMATPVMRHLMVFLKDKGVVSPDPKVQRDLIKQIWFNMYSRGQGKIGSSGFEHIFLSEIKNNEISGLHNWLYFATQEASNQANYLGYMKKLDINDKNSILKLHFTLKGIDKPVDTMFVGTSPELELALYSLCFITRADKACPLSLGGQQFGLRTHTFRYRSKNMIGSAFPEL